MGASWRRLGAVLGSLGGVLGCLRTFWAVFRASWGHLGVVLGAPWRRLGDVLGCLVGVLGALCATLGWLGAPSGPPWGVRTKSNEKQKVLKNHWFYSIPEPLGCRGGVLKRLVRPETHLGKVFRTSRDGRERLRSILGGMLERHSENHQKAIEKPARRKPPPAPPIGRPRPGGDWGAEVW